ncbi:MAG: flagellar protein [Clostridiales bacterium]|jgi:hypothetical protein|nr:flagellar protein [Clostridiales bacterium]
MEVRACKNCRRLFKYIYGPELCPNCRILISKDNDKNTNNDVKISLKPMIQEEQEKFTQVRDYIMANPKATIMEIAQANGVSANQLLEWVREERFEFSEESKFAWFQCEKCGVKIKSGRLCNLCKIR